MTMLSSKSAKSSNSPKRPVQKKQNKLGPYNLLQTLGEGEFGKVKLGIHSETGQEVAIKLIKKEGAGSDTRINKVEREISVLKTLNHPYIVKLFNVVETEKYIGIILEYASGGELFEYILAHRYLKEKDAKRFFAQLISSVQYMHKRKIVHRDLKLENLLLDKNRNIIVTDFGFANQFDLAADDLMATTCGSPCYAAPELVVNAGLYAGSAVDIWSCGVILYAMICGFLPFDDDPSNPDSDNINQLYRYILSTHLMFPSYVSADARDLLQRMLVPDPTKRCSLEYIIQHPWLDIHREFLRKDAHQIKMEAAEAAKLSSSSNSYVTTDMENHHPPNLVLTNSVSTTVPPTSEKILAGENQPASRKTHIPVAATRDRFAPVANDKYHSTGKTKQATEKSSKSGPFRHFTIGRSSATTSTAERPTVHATVTPTTTTKNSKVPSFISRKPIKKEEEIVDTSDASNPEKSLSSPLLAQDSKIPTMSAFGSIRKNQRRGADKFLSFFTGGGSGSGGNRNGRASHIPVVSKNDEFGIFDSMNNNPQEVIKNSATEDTLLSLQSNLNDGDDEEEDEDEEENENKLRTLRANSESSTIGGSTPSLCMSSSITDPSSPLSPAVPPSPPQHQPQTNKMTALAVTTNYRSRSAQQVHIDTSSMSDSHDDSTAVSPTIVGDTIEEEIEEEEEELDYQDPNISAFSLRGNTSNNEDEEGEYRHQVLDRGNSMSAASMLSEKSVNSSSLSFKDAPRRTPLIFSSQKTGSSSLKMRKSSTTSHGQKYAIENNSSILSDHHTDNASISSTSSPYPEVSTSGKLVQKSVVSNAMGDGGRKAIEAVRRSIYRKHKSQPPQSPMSDASSQTSSNYGPKEPIISFAKSRFEENTTTNTNNQRRASDQSHRNTWSATPATTTDTAAVTTANTPPKKTGKKMMDWIKKKSHAKENKKETLTPTTTAKSHISGQILTKSRKSHTPAVVSNEPTNVTAHRSPEPAVLPNSRTGSKQLVSILEPPKKSTRVSILPTTNERSSNKKKEEIGVSRRSTRAISGNDHDLMPSTPGGVDERIQIHQGAIDRTALTSQPPADIVKDVKRILRILGIEAKAEGSSPYLLKCSRKKAKAFKGRRGGGDDDDDDNDMNPIDDDQFIINDSNITTTSDISLVAPSNPDSVISSTSSAGGVLTTVARGLEPIYGDASIDNGDEIRFAVEVCRFQNLPGLYIIDIRRLKGNVWAYKFLYHKLIDFLNVGRDSAFVL